MALVCSASVTERSGLDRLWSWLTEPLEQRTSPELDASAQYPDIDAQLFERLRIRTQNASLPTVKEAMGIPAVLRSVSLLASAAGSLNLIEYINGTPVTDASTVVRRPMREWIPARFFLNTVHHMAGYGEALWVTLSRSVDGSAANVVPIVPRTVRSEWDGIRHRWFGKRDGKEFEYDPANIKHIPMLQDPETGRGMGPLQLCGAALNVAVEAERWAARFYVGGIPSVFLKSEMPVDEQEATTIKEQWLADPPNLPKVGYGLTPQQMGFDAENAQLTGSRMLNRGEVALMFGIPGRLLEYAESGSSVTYANVGDLATELVRLTLAPMYLELIEQTFSDLLPRGHEVRFDVEGFQRADPKTRYEVHEKAIALGVYDAEYAAAQEGVRGQNPEVRPVPNPQSLRVVV